MTYIVMRDLHEIQQLLSNSKEGYKEKEVSLPWRNPQKSKWGLTSGVMVFDMDETLVHKVKPNEQ